MSRLTIRNDAAYEVVVGWDPPLKTFFAQVFDQDEWARQRAAGTADGDGLVVWRGVAPGDVISSVDELREIVGAYAEIPYSHEVRLEQDKRWNR